MNAANFKNKRTLKGFEFGRIALVSSSVFLASVMVGCKSNPTVPQESEQPVAAETVNEVEVKTEGNNVAVQQEADADAMMASLAAKSKYDEVDEEPQQEPSDKAPAVEPPKTEPKKSAKPVSKSVTKSTAKPVKKSSEVEKKPAVAPVSKPQTKVVEEVPVQPKQVEKPAKKVVSAKALNITESDLPADVGLWTIRKGEAQLDEPIVISTPTWEMGEEGYNSQIWLTLMAGKVLVSSSSDIYAKDGEAGIKIDGGDLIPFSSIESNNTAIIEGDHLDKLASGKQMEILMGFFPDRERKSDLYKSTLDLDDLGRVVATYKNLIK